MKLSSKIFACLTAIMLAASPIFTIFSTTQPVQAAKNKHTVISLIDVAYVYNGQGHKIKERKGTTSGFSTDVRGYAYVDPIDSDNYFGYGTKTIRSQKYYRFGKDLYFSAADVQYVNNKNTKKGKLVLNHNSYLYTKKGKRTKTKLGKKAIVKYRGKVKSARKLPKFFYYQFNQKNNKELIRYLPTRKVKGKYYYAVGKNRYVNAHNVGSIDGEIARYNGVTTAKVLKSAYTETLTTARTKHKLKKGQKIKIDLAVAPRAEDFEGYVYRLHDYPDEYIDGGFIQVRINLPTADYAELAYTFVSSKAETVKLYDSTGKLTGRSVQNHDHRSITVDGIFYFWNAATGKAELFYHYLNGSHDTNALINNDGTKIEPPKFDNQTGLSDESVTDKLIRSNSFIKASDVNYTGGIKLKPVNRPEDAQADQRVATTAEKASLQKEFTNGQNNPNQPSRGFYRFDGNYGNALINASLVLRSDKSTVAQVKEATWLLKTTRTQVTTLNFPEFS